MDFSVIAEHYPKLLEGALVTLQVSFLSLFLGILLAVPLALCRLSQNRIVSSISYAYVLCFRGTPLLVQIFLIYYGSGQFRAELTELGLWTYFRSAWFCALLSLTMNTTAYTSEIFRGAIQAVPRGDIEAAKACGMSGFLLFRRIVLPKAFRLALPAYVNEIVFTMQASSLVSVITILDLTGAARKLVSKTFEVYEVYLTAALMYFIMTYAIVLIFRQIEKRLSGHLQRANVSAPGRL